MRRARPVAAAAAGLAVAILAAAGAPDRPASGRSAAALRAAIGEDPHLAAVPRSPAEAARVAAALAPPADPAAAEPLEAMGGGAATARRPPGADAFSQPSANMPAARRADFERGAALFRRLWIAAPSPTTSSDGLGPLYGARACGACHRGNGRGHPPEAAADEAPSMAAPVSTPAAAHPLADRIPGWIPTAPDPVYGEQLQDFAAPGHRAEHRLGVAWREFSVPLSDGETATLREPSWRADALGYGPLAEGAMLSPRVAPPMIGLGLLEAVPAADILARADPDDRDGDGISGRASIVWSAEFDRPMLGRFGWKAGAPTVLAQSAAAFAGDMGLSTRLRPAGWGDCTEAQTACRAAPDGGDPDQGGLEVGDAALDLVTFYGRNLAVPVRRDAARPETLRGKAAFHAAGCPACHTPTHVTHRLADRPEQSFQLIRPYTDLLLHDMGEGLADGRPEGVATGREWRTPPLWGVGLTAIVGGRESYLHDGRARTLLEAVLWHGGEAEAAREAVRTMPAADRAALICFLRSL